MAVTSAAAVLCVMAVVGLGYAVATVAVAPGLTDRFRSSAVGVRRDAVEGYVTVVWIGAAIALVLALVLVALYVTLAVGLRRGSNGARIATWVVAGLGLIAGCGSTATVLIQRRGEPVPGSIGAALADAYPHGWIGWNVTLAVAQMLGYILVAALLAAAPGAYFGRRPAPGRPPVFYPPVHQPAIGYPSAVGQPGVAPPAAPVGPHSVASNPWARPPGDAPGAAGGTGYQPAAPSAPAPGPDDEFWSRPST
ncbi:hypothetical protein [Mangrovihabitans endophyticus]|uniref:hypothetical protein n=1 Tax=Mangrovihabitans endophyticus TaxID=1751298 RepID=UPI0016643545|nr:hypothetical protein [Mangrovihabitans endophyticus]